MARRRKARRGGIEHRTGVARASISARYHAAKREYHRLGDALYKAGHGGRSAHGRKRRSKSRRSR